MTLGRAPAERRGPPAQHGPGRGLVFARDCPGMLDRRDLHPEGAGAYTLTKKSRFSCTNKHKNGSEPVQAQRKDDNQRPIVFRFFGRVATARPATPASASPSLPDLHPDILQDTELHIQPRDRCLSFSHNSRNEALGFDVSFISLIHIPTTAHHSPCNPH